MFLELSKQGVFDDQWTADVQKNLALKRWGQPEEVGHAVVYLASEKAAYVTGQQIAVAGGYGLWCNCKMRNKNATILRKMTILGLN